MKRNALFIAVFSFHAFYSINAQNLAQTFELAEHLLSLGQYGAALENYERVLFFDEENQYKSDCFYQMAVCSQKLGRWNEAGRYYNLAFYATEEDEIHREIQFQLVAVKLLSQDFIAAKEELFVLEELLAGEEEPRFLFYSGIAAFVMENYDSAEVYLNKYLGEDLDARIRLQQLFTQNEKISRINPKRARILSIILPGLGQFYAGDVKSGLNSLILTAGIMALGIHVGITVSLWDALLTVAPWYMRYFQGGFKAAERIATQKKVHKRAGLYQALIDLLAEQRN